MPSARDGRRNKDMGVISFNTIGNNSILHHAPSPPETPKRTPGSTPKSTPKSTLIVTQDQKPAIDGYTMYPDDDGQVSKSSITRLSCTQCFSHFGNWYLTMLETHPVITKSITAGLLAAIGDISAQLIELGSQMRNGHVILFDTRRIFAMFIEGSCVSGPMLHFVFEFYEQIFPIHCMEECAHKCTDGDEVSEILEMGEGMDHDDTQTSASEAQYQISKRQYLNAFLHVAFDQVVMAFPYVGGMMIVTSLVEGHGKMLSEELQNEYLNNVRASWMAALGLAPFQFLAFRYLSINWRVLAVNLQDIVWVMVMSYVTHRTREVSEPFFDFETDDFYMHDDLFTAHDVNQNLNAGDDNVGQDEFNDCIENC